MNNDELKDLLVDVQAETNRSSRVKDVIIIVLIVLVLLRDAVVVCGYFWYESQFEYTTEETKEVEMSTEGENANIDYSENNVQGDQYNDNATHNDNEEGGN